MAVQIGARPDSGFDDPIGMLTDCHRRIERFLNILCVVAPRARGRALSQEEAEAIQASLQYFRVGGARHTADEEESLFPRLIAAAESSVREQVVQMEEDHDVAGRLHQTAEAHYVRWISEGELSEDQSSSLCSCTERLRQLYAEHIRVEEQTIFPRARAILDDGSLQALGAEFRKRRA